jgi:hypothetical protein
MIGEGPQLVFENGLRIVFNGMPLTKAMSTCNEFEDGTKWRNHRLNPRATFAFRLVPPENRANRTVIAFLDPSNTAASQSS